MKKLVIFLIAGYLLLATARYWYADYLYAKDDLDSVKKAVGIMPGEPKYREALAGAYAKAGVVEQSGKQLSIAMQKAPRNVALLKSIASIYSDLGEEIDKKYFQNSVAIYEKLTKLAPTDPYVWYSLALTYARIGERDKAASLLVNALDLKPDYEKAQSLIDYLK